MIIEKKQKPKELFSGMESSSDLNNELLKHELGMSNLEISGATSGPELSALGVALMYLSRTRPWTFLGLVIAIAGFIWTGDTEGWWHLYLSIGPFTLPPH